MSVWTLSSNTSPPLHMLSILWTPSPTPVCLALCPNSTKVKFSLLVGMLQHKSRSSYRTVKPGCWDFCSTSQSRVTTQGGTNIPLISMEYVMSLNDSLGGFERTASLSMYTSWGSGLVKPSIRCICLQLIYKNRIKIVNQPGSVHSHIVGKGTVSSSDQILEPFAATSTRNDYYQWRWYNYLRQSQGGVLKRYWSIQNRNICCSSIIEKRPGSNKHESISVSTKMSI